MDDEHEWIYYPFKVRKKEDVLLYKLEKGYELRFTKDLFSKRVNSTIEDQSKNFLEIEINDNEVKIISQFKKIHKFITPADFYVPISEESRKFYESIHQALINNDLTALTNKAIEVAQIARKDGFPEMQLPITTTSSHFENFESSISRTDNLSKVPICRIKYGEPIPENYLEETYLILKSQITAEQFKLQDEFYKSYFRNTPISKLRTIINEYEKQDDIFKQIIQLNLLKRCVSLHAYFTSSGPWRKCWIRFGYDPSLIQDCFRYQIIEIRSKKVNFQIYQKPEIVAEVDKNKDWYLLNECDPMDGFLSKTLKNLIIYTIDNVGVKEIDKRIEEAIDFDVFDM